MVNEYGKYLIAYDIGTSGTKAVITDLKGNMISSATERYKLIHIEPLWAEQDPDEWWKAVILTTKKVIETSKISPENILGVSFSAQMLGTLPVNKKGKPLRPCMTWLDLRSERQAKWIKENVGLDVSAKDPIAKILWLKENKPDTFNQAYKILDCKDYIVYKFTENFVTDLTCAQAIAFDVEKREWSKELCSILDIPIDKFPKVVKSTETVGEITSQAAKETGLKRGTPVICGAGDFPCAVVGSGAIKYGRAHLYVGSSGWVALSVKEKYVDPKGRFFTMLGVDPTKWVLGFETENASSCIEWFKDNFARDLLEEANKSGEDPYTLIDGMAEKVEAGSKNLIFTPWMWGERAPIRDDYARGAFIGLSFTHTKAHLIRAIMEGVAYNIRWILELIEQLTGLKINSLRSIGGGMKSKVWAQIFADITGKNIQVVKWPQHAGAIGAALTAAVGLNVYKKVEDLDALLPVMFEVKPREKYYKVYNPIYNNFKEAYSKLSGIYHSTMQ